MGAEQSPNPRSCVVIGGGLAGLAAACALADRGWQVTILEKRRWLGGRASSFVDPTVGSPVDLGQHVLMRCFTAYLSFLERLGIKGSIFLQPRLWVPLVDARTGRRGVLFSQPWLPPPLHLLASFLAYPHLSLAEKVRAIRGILAAQAVNHAHRPGELDGITFQQWLHQHGQLRSVIQRLWEPIILGTLNALPAQVSASVGIMVVQEALLAGPHSADMGWPKAPLSSLLEGAVQRYLHQRGGRVCTGAPVMHFTWDGECVRGVMFGNG
ncbi:MAG: FAD-dependent oxidoreductase, partial [Dehalococcoidia bacterium]